MFLVYGSSLYHTKGWEVVECDRRKTPKINQKTTYALARPSPRRVFSLSCWFFLDLYSKTNSMKETTAGNGRAPFSSFFINNLIPSS